MCATIKFSSRCHIHTALVRPLAAVVTLLIQDCACQQPTIPCDDKPAGIVNDLHKLPATDLDRPQLGSIVYILGENIHFGCIRIGLERLGEKALEQIVSDFFPVPVQLCGSDQNNLRRSYTYYTHIHIHTHTYASIIRPDPTSFTGYILSCPRTAPGTAGTLSGGKGDRSISVCKIPRSQKKDLQHSFTLLFYFISDLTSSCSDLRRLDLSHYFFVLAITLPTSTVFFGEEYPN